jgi:4-hydroxybenzoate polyprenyltransferase
MARINFTSRLFETALDRKTRYKLFFWNAVGVGLVFGLPTLAGAVLCFDETAVTASCSLSGKVFAVAAAVWSLINIKKLKP